MVCVKWLDIISVTEYQQKTNKQKKLRKWFVSAVHEHSYNRAWFKTRGGSSVLGRKWKWKCVENYQKSS
jgi:hypothetical protein